MLKRLLSVFALSLIGLSLVVGSASAATVVQLNFAQLVDESDVIVTARVTDIDAERADDGRVYTTTRFETDEIFDGDVGKEFSIRQVGGRADDIATHAPGVPRFQERERVLLFLKQRNDRLMLTGLSQGKFQIAVGPDDETDFVIPSRHTRGDHLVEPDKEVDEGKEFDGPKAPFDINNHRALYHRAHAFPSFRLLLEETIQFQRENNE